MKGRDFKFGMYMHSSNATLSNDLVYEYDRDLFTNKNCQKTTKFAKQQLNLTSNI